MLPKLLSLMIVLVVFGGCGEGDRMSPTSDQTQSSPGAPSGSGESKEYGGDSRAPAAPPQSSPGGAMGASSDTIGENRQIIRTGDISLRVEVLDSAERALKAVVASSGGYTASSSRVRLEGSALTSTVEVRIPSNRFDALLDTIRRLGDVESESITASDVTEEYVDLEARLKGQQELEARLLKLLAERTAKLTDVVEVEQKLAEVRTTIEGIQGRLRYLRSRVMFSTLTVRMTEPGTITPHETETFGGRIMHAIVEGFDMLTRMIAGLITLLLALLPLVILGIIVWYVVRRRRHSRRETTAVAQQPVVTPPARDNDEPVI